jgi:hypothetical protein
MLARKLERQRPVGHECKLITVWGVDGIDHLQRSASGRSLTAMGRTYTILPV